MAKVTDIIKNPAKYTERAIWKSRRFYHSARYAMGPLPEWQRAMNRKLEVVDYGPLHIFLESASPCNLKCPMCPTGLGQVTRKPGFLNPELAEKLASELTHTPQYVGLWLAGEPLMNRHLGDCLRSFSDRKIPLRLHTNATLLTEEKSRMLIESGLDWLSFSFDGFDPETYAKMRVGGNYQRTLDNILNFLRMKKELNSKTPYTVIQLVTPYTEDLNLGLHPPTPERVKNLFKGLPVDEFQSIIAHAWSGKVDGDMIAPTFAGKGERTSCRIPYTDLTFTWEGDAVACCGDMNAVNVFGNLFERNLYDIWNGPEYQEFRRGMHTKAVESRPLCGGCDNIWSNPHPLDYTEKLKQKRYHWGF